MSAKRRSHTRSKLELELEEQAEKTGEFCHCYLCFQQTIHMANQKTCQNFKCPSNRFKKSYMQQRVNLRLTPLKFDNSRWKSQFNRTFQNGFV